VCMCVCVCICVYVYLSIFVFIYLCIVRGFKDLAVCPVPYTFPSSIRFDCNLRLQALSRYNFDM